MGRTRAIFMQRLHVQPGSVAFVLGECILRILHIESPHHPVPCHLGKDAGSSNDQ